jgi:hypothetical protein
MDPLRQAIVDISAKARELRDVFGDEGRARALEWASEQMAAALRQHHDEVVSLEEAARISGYSAEHLSRLVREGKIPDARPKGTKGRLIFRRRDVPPHALYCRYRDARLGEPPLSRQGGASCLPVSAGPRRSSSVGDRSDLRT